MEANSKRWTTVSDSQHDHEREALAWLRGALPDREPYHVWSNFEFVARSGALYEIDALAVTESGVYLIEIKGHPGEIGGDSATWQWIRPNGSYGIFDNPRLLANRKAKALADRINRSKVFTKHGSAPFIEEVIFLSDPDLKVTLSPPGRHSVYGRDAPKGEQIPKQREKIGGIVEAITSLHPEGATRPKRRIDKQLGDRLAKAVDEIGIRERSSRRKVGDYRLGELINDVESDVDTGVAHQDFEATHVSLPDVRRRLRLYPLELNADTERREAASRAARREFELLHPLNHAGIVRPVEYTDHERGPVLFFDYDPDEQPLSRWLRQPEVRTRLTVDDRLALLRQIAEAVAYANTHGVYHRALCPSAVLVTESDGDIRARVSNWHAGARVSIGETGTGSITGTVHPDALSGGDAALYRAPEFHQAKPAPALLDVFSLGALAVFLFSGEHPAATRRKLDELLITAKHLPGEVLVDGLDDSLAMVIEAATQADPAQRIESVPELLSWLDFAEEEQALPDPEEYEPHPLEARRGEVFGAGRFELLHRLGQGSTAVALLVRDREHGGRLAVLKVARDREHNDRIIDEGAALEGLRHPNIVELLDGPLDLADHAALLVSYAGPKVAATKGDKDTVKHQPRTLADRLGQLPGPELQERFGADLLDALRYLEGFGRAHRDIKPENLGVAPQGDRDELHLVLFDFSLSKAPLDSVDAGTPGYLDPFLKQRGRWDPAADRFAAAVTLFELTTGHRPRYGDGGADPAMVDSIAAVEESMFDSSVATGLAGFFRKALARDVADRYDTADDMALAWRHAFREAAQPTTHPATPTPVEDGFVVPDSTTHDTPLAGLPLARRALNALERHDVVTVGDLLGVPAGNFQTMQGVGAKTRREVLTAVAALRAALGGPAATDAPRTSGAPTEPGEPTPQTLVDIATSLVPRPKRSDQGTLVGLATVIVGLDDTDGPWAAMSQLADRHGVTRARIYQLTDKLRERWSKQPALTEIRSWMEHELTAASGIATADQLASRLAQVRPASGDTHQHHRAAAGIVRAATLVEESMAGPRWQSRRRGDTVTLTAESADADGANAQALADYAIEVANRTSQLVADRPVISRQELLDELQHIRLPAGATPVPSAHLAELAAELCDTASVNSRLELYRTGLGALDALKAARRAFVAGGPMTSAEIAAKVRARFPAAEPVPDRPELDTLLQQADIELDWNPSDSTYHTRHYQGTETSLTSAVSISRHVTGQYTQGVTPVEIDVAADFEQRLHSHVDTGGMFVLVTEPVQLERAAQELARLPVTTVDVDTWLVEELQRICATGKPSWELVVAADADGPGSPRWANVRKVIDRALDSFTERLLDTSGTVLLTHLGLLARYDRLDLVARWRDRLLDGGHPLQALWMLVATPGIAELPTLDGKAVPVIGRGEWSRIPADWLRNAHRTGAIS